MPLDKFVRLFNEGSGQYGEYNDLNNDPSFANLSLADRESLQRDARGQATDEYGSLLKQQQQQYNTDYNALLTGLYDGTQLQSSIDKFRQDHPGMDFNDIKKAQDTLDNRLGDNKALLKGSRSWMLAIYGCRETLTILRANALLLVAAAPKLYRRAINRMWTIRLFRAGRK